MLDECDDLAQNFLDEDPSILTNDDFQRIADAFGMTLEAIKVIADHMTAIRREFRKQLEEEE